MKEEDGETGRHSAFQVLAAIDRKKKADEKVSGVRTSLTFLLLDAIGASPPQHNIAPCNILQW